MEFESTLIAQQTKIDALDLKITQDGGVADALRASTAVYKANAEKCKVERDELKAERDSMSSQIVSLEEKLEALVATHVSGIISMLVLNFVLID